MPASPNIDLSDSGDDTRFGGGLLFNLTDSFSLSLSGTGTWDDDVSVYQASARLYSD